MKNFLKLFLCLIIVSVFSISNIYAKPKLLISKKFVKLPADTYKGELAVNSGTLYYMTVASNKTYVFAKPILISKSSANIVLDNIDYIPTFKLLSDSNLYAVGSSGNSKIGHKQISLLNKSEKADINHFGNGTVDFDTSTRTLEFLSDPNYITNKEQKDFYYSYGNTIMDNNADKTFKFSPNFSSIRKNNTYLLKLPSNSNKNPDKSKYGIVSINHHTKREQVLAKGISSMTMGENSIYYWVFDENTTSFPYSLYKYSLNDKKTTLVCKHNDPDYNIIQIKNKVFFMGNESYTARKQGEKRNYSTLYMAANEKAVPLYSNMKRAVSDGNNIAVLFEKKSSCEVRIINKDGGEFAKIMIPSVSQTDLSMSKNEIIVWSWKDKIVRYYQLPI